MKDNFPPWWVPYVVVIGIFAPLAIAWFVAVQFGAWPAMWTMVAIVMTRIGGETARKYYRKVNP